MPERRGIDLSGYVEVKERIRLFLEQYPDGRLVTLGVQLTTEPDGKPRVMVEAAAYRTSEDGLPGKGWSWMELPGTTNYTRGSELENTETSAWGRAIAALGIGIGQSIASKQEVDAKAGHAEPVASPEQEGLVGTAKAHGNDDFELRQGPEGSVLPFRLANGRKSWKVLARGVLAELIAEWRAGIEDKTVTCWGTLADRSFVNRDHKTITYQVLELSRIKAGDLDFTEPEPDEGEGPTEAESMELGMLAFPDPVPA